MRGETVDSDMRGDLIRMTARVPMTAALDFHTRLAAMTSGRGAMTQRLDGYRERPMDEEATCPRQGVHPLDTAKYILAVRNALDEGVY
jgi:ribosomal protection tetracycline resistance protein